MRTSLGIVIILAAAALAFSGCTRSAPDTSKITIKLPLFVGTPAAKKISESQSSNVGLLNVAPGTKWGLDIPSTSGEMNCFAIGYSAPDLTENITCRDLKRSLGRLHDIVGFFPAGSVQTIEVPSGRARQLELVGMKTDDLALCSELGLTGGVLPVERFSPPVKMAVVVQDLNPGDVNVTFQLQSGYPYGAVFEDCDEKPFAASAADVTLPAAVNLSGPEVGTLLNSSPFYSWDPVAPDGGSAIQRYQIAIGVPGDIVAVSADWVDVGLTYNYYSALWAYLHGSTYTFSVRAKDNAGNYGPVTTKTWVVNNVNAPWKQQAYFKADNADPADWFGQMVAIDGDWMVVGANIESSGQQMVTATPPASDNSLASSGAAYVYKRNVNGTWQLSAFLKADDAAAGDQFGISVAISGNRIAVGAQREDSRSTAIAVSGDNSNNGTDVGAVYTYIYDGNNWVKENYIKAPDGADSANFGSSVALDKETLVVGANGATTTATSSGAVYVFNRSATAWSFSKKLLLSAPETGDFFGYNVSVHGDRIVASAPSRDNNAGIIAVYEKAGSDWPLKVELQAHNKRVQDFFGFSVAIYGDRIAVGAPREDGTTQTVAVSPSFADSVGADVNPGAVYVFERVNGTWTQSAYAKPSNSAGSQGFGVAVGLFGSTLVVGADGEKSISNVSTSFPDPVSTDASAPGSGAVYVFQIQANGSYIQSAYLKPPNSASAIYFGSEVAISHSGIVVGAFGESSNATGVTNSDSISTGNAGGTSSGAAYVFEPNIP